MGEGEGKWGRLAGKKRREERRGEERRREERRREEEKKTYLESKAQKQLVLLLPLGRHAL